MGFLPYTLELQEIILSNIEKQIEKDFFLKIINRFNEKGLKIKAKHMFPKKPISFYRIFCFKNKSTEALTIDGNNPLSIRIRIENKSTFEKLNGFTDNVRNQILNAKDCSAIHSIDCKDKMYIFTFNGHKYIKCVSISSNFKFTNINKSDFANIMDIINSEIEFINN